MKIMLLQQKQRNQFPRVFYQSTEGNKVKEVEETASMKNSSYRESLATSYRDIGLNLETPIIACLWITNI